MSDDKGGTRLGGRSQLIFPFSLPQTSPVLCVLSLLWAGVGGGGGPGLKVEGGLGADWAVVPPW